MNNLNWTVWNSNSVYILIEPNSFKLDSFKIEFESDSNYSRAALFVCIFIYNTKACADNEGSPPASNEELGSHRIISHTALATPTPSLSWFSKSCDFWLHFIFPFTRFCTPKCCVRIHSWKYVFVICHTF